jgi:hypothetical protein
MEANQQARIYLARGWAVIPIPTREKKPVIKVWENLRITESQLDLYFIGNSNIGVLTGEPSVWLIDVDLDHQFARELADAYLPSTGAEFGRASVRRSHRLFLATCPVDTVKWQSPKVEGKKQMIVELRSTGAQTVFPGSVHPSGEQIEWDRDGEPARVPPQLLTAGLNALAEEVKQRLGFTKTAPSQNCRPIALPADVVERARIYLASIPPAVSGQGGHNQTFHAACVLTQGFALDRGSALELLKEWNQSCQPPWTDHELEHKIDDALEEPGERGNLLNSSGEEPKSNSDCKADARTIDPSVAAKAYFEKLQYDRVSLYRYWRGSWWVWVYGAYIEIADSDMRAVVIRELDQSFRNLSSNVVNNIFDHLRALAIIPGGIEPGTWIANNPPSWPPTEILATRTTLIHLPSLIAGADNFTRPATPQLFTTAALDFDFNMQAPRPEAWLSFLSQLWPHDSQSIETLQEWMGYLLTPDTRQQKILLLVGPKRSGKGTIARVVGELVGRNNMAGPTLASLSTNFGLAPLLGKLVAILSDARLSSRTDSAIVIERLLAIKWRRSVDHRP